MQGLLGYLNIVSKNLWRKGDLPLNYRMNELAVTILFGFGVIVGILIMGSITILWMIENNKSRYGVIAIPKHIKEKAREYIVRELKTLELSYDR